MPPQIFSGKYIVQEEIARGGMGVIYKALDRTLNRIVAIKRIHAHLSGDPSFSERFLREARAMARIQHDNIVTIFAVEEDEGTQFLVMEFFGPTNLRTLIRQPHRLPAREVVRIGEQLSSALAYAHSQGIIHRDIKPANVLIDKRGKPKLTDFGIAAALDEASITSTGQVIGTPEYMSPEQARGVKVDGRSDLYSLGVMLYEMVNGKPPYGDSSKTAILGKLVFEQQELSLQFPHGTPSMLQGVIRDLLRRNPDERISDAETLANQLHEILYTLPHGQSVMPTEETDATLVTSVKPLPREEPTKLVSSQTQYRSEPAGRTILEEKTRLLSQPPSEPRRGSEHPPLEGLDETSLLPSQTPLSRPHNTPEQEATSSPRPRVSSSLPLVPLVGGGIVLVGAALALVLYLAKEPPVPTPIHQTTTQNSTEGMSRTDELEKQRQELAEETKRLEEKQRAAEAQQAKDDAARRDQERQRERAQRAKDEERKRDEERMRLTAQKVKDEAERREQERLHDVALQQEREEQQRKAAEETRLAAQKASDEAEREKVRQRETALQRARDEDKKRKAAEEEKARAALLQAKEEADRKEQERQRELALQRTRDEEEKRKAAELEKSLQVARAFPDTKLETLLNKFKTAYERRDLEALSAISRMDESRARQVDLMFTNYIAFKASIQNVAKTDKGATGVLVLESGTRTNGETIDVPSMSRKYKLQIPRLGEDWDKIVW